MHNTEVKPEASKTPCVPNATDPYQHPHQHQHQHPHQQHQHPHLNMTNGEVGVARHHREPQGPGMGAASTNECAGCGKKITDRFLLKALDMFWHEDCLKCGCCDCRLGEVGSSCYTKANLILCKRDYLRLFGNTGYCAACSKVIPAFEMVMRARNNVYHLECFACQQCNHRFCVGDRFYLCENKILCVYDYEERMVFANMAYSPNLALLRRQVTNFQQPGGTDGERQPHQQQLEKGQQSFPVRKAPVAEPLVNGPSPSSSAIHSPENGHVMNAWGNSRQTPTHNYNYPTAAARYPAPTPFSYDEYHHQRMYAMQLQQHAQAHHHHANPISSSSAVLSAGSGSSNAADDNISTSPDSGIVEGP